MRGQAFDQAVRDVVERIPHLAQSNVRELSLRHPDEWDSLVRTYYREAGISEIFDAIQDSRYINTIESLLTADDSDPIEIVTLIRMAMDLNIRDYICRQISLRMDVEAA